MWKRKDVKAKGKATMKANFWKCVATALILAIIGGGSAGISSPGFSAGSYQSFQDGISIEDANELDDIVVDEIEVNESEDNRLFSFDEEQPELELNFDTDDIGLSDGAVLAAVVIIFIISFIALLVILAVAFALTAFVTNPVELGCKRFFRKNLEEPANMSNIFYAFDHNYKNTVKTMFLRTLYTFFWSLLFIIPGIVKAYEYRLIPYILSENPEMSTEEVFELSKKLMTGNKWKAFVYDLSFIGWHLLSAFTCGLVGIFYVNPYKAASDAALYEAIRYGA